MIGNTVDTDLIGELVEVVEYVTDRYQHTADPRIAVRGRVRAVTTTDGKLILWVHIEDEECQKTTRNFAVHDIVNITIPGNKTQRFLRLIREGQKP